MISTDGRDPNILLIEDDDGLASMVADSLRGHGYTVWRVDSGNQAELAVDEVRPDVIVLDLMLPDRNGLTLCGQLKRRAQAPIIICSATRRKDDALIGFELGADDFVRKPFSVDELRARIDMALRRQPAPDNARPPANAQVHHIGSIGVDERRCEVTVNGTLVPLTPTEFRLLQALARKAPDVGLRNELAEAIWGCVDDGVIRSLDVHMRRLRAKLTAAAPDVRLVTRRGFGYQLLDTASLPVRA